MIFEDNFDNPGEEHQLISSTGNRRSLKILKKKRKWHSRFGPGQ